jgi:hypothetical protein
MVISIEAAGIKIRKYTGTERLSRLVKNVINARKIRLLAISSSFPLS